MPQARLHELSDLRGPGDAVAVDYRDTPELFDSFAQNQARLDGHAVDKFRLRMADYGLRYEVISSPAKSPRGQLGALDAVGRDGASHALRSTRRLEQVQAALAVLLRGKRHRAQAFWCLVHARHWVHWCTPTRALPAVRGRLQQMGATATRSNVAPLEA